MRTLTYILTAVFLLAVSIDQTAWARGGGGGGGGRGGGGRPSGGGGGMSRPSGGSSRPSGGFSGGVSRPSGGSSGMSRPSGGYSGGVSRPSTPSTRPSGGISTGTRPSGGISTGTRPSGGMSTGTRPSTPSAGTRPNAGQVNKFLGLPGDVGAAKPSTLPAGGGTRPISDGGSGIGGRPSTLPAGGNKPGGIGGPGKPGGIGGPGKPGGIGGAGGIGGPGRPGGIGGAGRPGTGPGGRPVPPHGTRPGQGGGGQYHNRYSQNIQNNFYNYGGYHGGCPYTHSWWSTYPGAAWTMFGVTVGAFALSSFVSISHFFDDPVVIVQEPVPYYYGDTIYYVDNTVYITNQAPVSAEAYYQQANTLATTGAPDAAAQGEDWLPLGVFAITGPNDTNATTTVQLAVNKQGTMRGNQFDLTTSANYIVKGAVDKKTQKVAWTAGSDTNVVYETGLANLTEEQSTVLVHYGKDAAEIFSLVHINEPPEATSEETSGT